MFFFLFFCHLFRWLHFFPAGPLWPITATACLLTGPSVAPVAAPLVITPQERETHMRTHSDSDSYMSMHTQWHEASLTDCVIASQELIIKLQKNQPLKFCVLMCRDICVALFVCMCTNPSTNYNRETIQSGICEYVNAIFYKTRLNGYSYIYFLCHST